MADFIETLHLARAAYFNFNRHAIQQLRLYYNLPGSISNSTEYLIYALKGLTTAEEYIAILKGACEALGHRRALSEAEKPDKRAAPHTKRVDLETVYGILEREMSPDSCRVCRALYPHIVHDMPKSGRAFGEYLQQNGHISADNINALLQMLETIGLKRLSETIRRA